MHKNLIIEKCLLNLRVSVLEFNFPICRKGLKNKQKMQRGSQKRIPEKLQFHMKSIEGITFYFQIDALCVTKT